MRSGVRLFMMKPSFLNLILFNPFTVIDGDKATKSVSICQGLFGIAVFAVAPLGEIPENVNNSLDKAFFVKNYYFVTYLLRSKKQLKYRRNR